MTARVVDAFDLPDWLGTTAVRWTPSVELVAGPRIEGLLSHDDAVQPLDLLAVDAAYPRVSCPESERRAAHQAWVFGEIVLLDLDGRICVGIPGRSIDANLACEAIRRVARAVAAEPGSFTVCLHV